MSISEEESRLTPQPVQGVEELFKAEEAMTMLYESQATNNLRRGTVLDLHLSIVQLAWGSSSAMRILKTLFSLKKQR